MLGECGAIREAFGFGITGGLDCGAMLHGGVAAAGVILTGVAGALAAVLALIFALATLEAGIRGGRRPAVFRIAGGADLTAGERILEADSGGGVIGVDADNVDSSLI